MSSRSTPTISGDERDYLGEDKLPRKAGQGKMIKRGYNKRDRKGVKLAVRRIGRFEL